MRRFLIVGLLGLAACEYPGASGIGPPFDYSMAASAQWVVAGGLTYVCTYPTWKWDAAGSDCRLLDFSPFACGIGSSDGPAIAHSETNHRFVYVTWGGTKVCIASAPDNNPWNVDRGYVYDTASWNLSTPVAADRPFVTTSANKIAVTMDDSLQSKTHTLVLSFADVIAGSTPHTALINHSDEVRLVGAPKDDDGALFWTKVGAGSTITLGRVTGVPGSGGITTTSATVNLGAFVQEAWASYVSGHVYVASLKTDSGGQFVGFQELSSVTATPLAPTITRNGAFRLSAAPDPGAFGVYKMSMSVTPWGRGLVAWTSGGAPYLAFFSPQNTVGILYDNTLTGETLPRVDFTPLGAAYPDTAPTSAGHAPGEWYACVGWTDTTDQWNFAGGQHAVCVRDGKIP